MNYKKKNDFSPSDNYNKSESNEKKNGNVNTFQLLTLQIMSENSTSRARFFFYLSERTDNNHFTCQLYFLLRLSSSHMDTIFSNVLPFFLLSESNYQNLLIDWKRRGIIKNDEAQHRFARNELSMIIYACSQYRRREEICCVFSLLAPDEIKIVEQMFCSRDFSQTKKKAN
jgi:hypothetical protein